MRPERRRTRLAARVALALTASLVPVAAHAHPGRPPAPHDLWRAWPSEPATVAALALSAALYAAGVRALWRRAGTGAGVRRWEVAAFALGWLVLAAALLSPLHALGSALFSAHMAQHELLTVVAAPLLVLGRPGVPALWALPPRARRAVGGVLRRRAVRRAWRAASGVGAATVLHGAALWAWHLPALYQAALRSDVAHAAQHACFLGTALLFWWAVLAPGTRRVRTGLAVAALFATVMHTGLLGAFITLAPRLWYPAYAATTGPWGLTPLEDQQLAGLVMWVPGGLAYVAAALALLSRVLRADPRPPRRPRPARPIVNAEAVSRVIS